jgi:hypothetical protein
VSGLTGIAGVPPMSLSEMTAMLDDESAVGSASQAAGAPAAYADSSPSAQSIAFSATEKAQMEALQTTQLELASISSRHGAAPSTDLFA